MSLARLAGTGPVMALASAIVLAILALSPFFRGLFFPGEYLIGLPVLLAACAAYYVVHSGRVREHGLTVLEWAALAFVACYWAALPLAVAPRAALAEGVKYTSYLAAMWLVSRLARNSGWRLAATAVLTMAGVGVAVLGLGAAAGTFTYRGAFEGGRICSSLQYPNTAATYLTATLFLGAGLSGAGAVRGGSGAASSGAYPSCQRQIWLTAGRAVLAGCLAITFLAFVFTMSRGAWLVFPPLVLAMGILLPAGGRAQPLLTLLAAVGGGLVAVPFLGPVLAGPRGPAVWVWSGVAFLVAAALLIVGQGILTLVTGYLARAGRKATVATVVGVVLLVALVGVGSFVYLQDRAEPASRTEAEGRWKTLTSLLPSQLRQRLAAIRLSESGAQDRLQWTRDALRLVMQRPVLGAGGGGWNALYGTIQTYPYFSTEVHNHFAQVWVEVGTVGFLAYLAMWAGAALAFYRARYPRAGGAVGRGGGADRVLATAAFVAAAGLGIHSAIDFNLSLPAVALMLWALLGLVSAGERVSGPAGEWAPAKKRRVASAPGWLRVAVPVLCLAVVFLSVSLRVGYGAGLAGARALNQGKRDEALAFFQKAIRYDPWTASYHIDAAQILERTGSEEAPRANKDHEAQAADKPAKDPTAQARAQYERGVKLDPYDPQYRTVYGRFLLRQGDIKAALEQLRLAVTYRPAVAAGYENLAGAYLAVGKALADAGRVSDAVGYLKQVETVGREMEGRGSLAPAFVPAARRTPALTPRLAVVRGEAYLLLGEPSRAREMLEKARGAGDTKIEANLLLAAWARLTNGDAAPFLKELASVPDADKRVGQICHVVEKLSR